MKKILLVSLIPLAGAGQGIIWANVFSNFFLACTMTIVCSVAIALIGYRVLR